jgi:hypothetical protein
MNRQVSLITLNKVSLNYLTCSYFIRIFSMSFSRYEEDNIERKNTKIYLQLISNHFISIKTLELII